MARLFPMQRLLPDQGRGLNLVVKDTSAPGRKKNAKTPN